VLPKWLYLSDATAHFEAVAERLVRLVRQRDARIGVDPKPREGGTRRKPVSRTTRARRDGP
jgi:hypothetical protein